ncbi:MAG TPA: heme ABC exporter ATP-binding protein CcmA [Vicinamibacterales bacterium]|nr:heme ABC exporter ATP-binding protein CcmA [Vicinamibacterales bacterium]
MIAAANLTRTFGDRVAVNAVSFEIARGEILALLGPNGAGKTTTMRMLAGLIAPTSGTVTIDGVTLTRATGTALRARIGFLTESPGLWDRLTVRENLDVYARLYGIRDRAPTIDRALDRFQMTDRSSTRAAELSKGMRQKVAIARALLHQPDVLLLDEPTSGLDPEIARSVRALLEERRAAGCSILVSTHNLDEAERLADRVAVLQGRLVACDRPAALRRRLNTGRVLVRIADGSDAALETAKRFDAGASIVDGAVSVQLREPEQETPDLVASLVAAGARVLEVRAETPGLEDVYLKLINTGDQW